MASLPAPGAGVRLFVGNGTAQHPDAGVLLGNGYSWIAETCPSGGCTGGRGGVIGLGGNGGTGGPGGTEGTPGENGNP
ncbi:hypothetical protein [Mycolicibacterium sarraceniae]|uniref:PE-PGRS family protein n=1 Tax=Mycolicibacterium sarraceniae TaxID=1534348 RepID=A0A7I7SVG7_9MYCO|nr:hypothetical protein [Mycolicibacterium sarraceniae]BBY60798.1 hypothetical protein MSAR_39340 [Mycolicibacterium sarraceniae]